MRVCGFEMSGSGALWRTVLAGAAVLLFLANTGVAADAFRGEDEGSLYNRWKKSDCGDGDCDNDPAPPPPPRQMPPPPPPQPQGPLCEKGASSVLVEKCGPQQVQIGQRFTYTLRVSNPGSQPIQGVRLVEKLPAGFKLEGTTPQAQADAAGGLSWEMGTIAAGQVRTVTIAGMAEQAGVLTNQAYVTHATPVIHRLQVFQPALRLQKTGPVESNLCDPIRYQLVVTNTGTGIAQNVVIRDTLPPGMTTLDGRTSAVIPVGELRAGESRRANLDVRVREAGRYVNKAVAEGQGGLRDEADFTTVVRMPRLKVTKQGPKNAYLGHPVRYTVTVSNQGDGMAENVVLVDTLPPATTLKAASRGVTQSPGTPEGGGAAQVRWELGNIEPERSRQVTIVLVPTQIGRITNTANASMKCGPPASDQWTTTVSGISAILLEVVDLNDPVPVGDFTTYVITATNQGSSTGTNIRILVELEDNLQFVEAGGATSGRVEGARIFFEPLPQLGAGKKASWRVKVKGVKAGDVRFKAQMTSDQLTRPVLETEATNLFE